MKTSTKEIMRWLAILACGGFAAWTSITSLYYMATHFDGSWLGLIFPFAFLLLFTAPFYIVAFICFRRQYRELFHVLGVVGAIVVFGGLMSLPRHLHITEFFDRHLREMPWLCVVRLPFYLTALVGPFYAAGWVLRVCQRLAQRPSMRSSELPPADAAGSRSP